MSFGILVTGAREWTDEQMVYDVLAKHANQQCTLIHGNCEGLDIIAATAGEKLGFTIKSYPANWKKYGRSAGPIRNREMVRELLNYDDKIMYAFHDCLEQSRGTKDCVNHAKKVGIIAKIVKHKK